MTDIANGGRTCSCSFRQTSRFVPPRTDLHTQTSRRRHVSRWIHAGCVRWTPTVTRRFTATIRCNDHRDAMRLSANLDPCELLAPVPRRRNQERSLIPGCVSSATFEASNCHTLSSTRTSILHRPAIVTSRVQCIRTREQNYGCDKFFANARLHSLGVGKTARDERAKYSR